MLMAAPPDASALYMGRVIHERMHGIRHRLAYRVYMLLLDLDHIENRRPGLLGRGRFGLLSWRAGDHGDRSGRPLRVQVEGHLAEAGIDIAGGPIRLLTMPRILGYGFNPLSVFFCHHPDGTLGAILYEVTNTFHERHSYLIATPSADGPVRQSADKAFFVSPLMDMDLTSDFTVRPPGEAVEAALEPHGVAILIDAAHQCMTTRGVRHRHVTTVTSRFTGAFRTDKALQDRFLAFCREG